MLVVLQDFLPTVEIVMNSYLARMVDYEISFELPEQSDEKMELEIIIRDDKGERPVKSLS
jgi:hypothetical protein